MTWPYTIAILQGKKKMLKAHQISISISVPKIEQLSIRRIWPRFKDDPEITQYMPLISPERYPPRNFFYEIMHTKFRRTFNALVEEAKHERRMDLEHQNLIIKVDRSVMDEISNCSVWKDMSQSQISKRVNTSRVSRSKKASQPYSQI